MFVSVKLLHSKGDTCTYLNSSGKDYVKSMHPGYGPFVLFIQSVQVNRDDVFITFPFLRILLVLFLADQKSLYLQVCSAFRLKNCRGSI